MKIAIYIADLELRNARLMPWRVILEVARALEEAGDAVTVFSGKDMTGTTPPETISGVTVHFIPRATGKNREVLLAAVRELRIEGLFFPVAFARSYGWAAAFERQSNCRIVWYLPGGWYGVRQCRRASRVLGWRNVFPYWVQALYPKHFFFRRLRRGHIRPLICFSEYSRRRAARFYPENATFAALPGQSSELLSLPRQKPERKERYLLFFGPPNPIRGLLDILKAFERVAGTIPEVRLHLCLRNDDNTDAEPVRRRLAEHRFADWIDCRWNSCSPQELAEEIAGSYAVLKPFLIVPSEIPLAVLEAAAFGKPVVGTGPDGTGDFIRAFGLTVPHGNADKLAEAMIQLLTDEPLYRDKVRAALKTAQEEPTWQESAKIWQQAAQWR